MTRHPTKVLIGSRWKPGHRIYRDSDKGEYSEVNSPIDSSTERLMQLALLAKPVSRLRYLANQMIRM